MKATEQLHAENEAITLMLKIMEAICLKLDSGEKVSPQPVSKIIEFFREFVHKCHHGKVEFLLFPAMEAAGVYPKLE
jgi:hemerythrin-like domain-containing protein